MTFSTQPPSLRLRDDLNALLQLARMAPPDETDWGWDTYAAKIRSTLAELDQDFREPAAGVPQIMSEDTQFIFDARIRDLVAELD